LAALRKIVEGELQPRGFKEPRRWENSVAYRQEDEKRFEAFVSKQYVSLFSHKGYTQWQGSDAQKALQVDIPAKTNTVLCESEISTARDEYYDHFPLTFRDFVKQEVRTGKWKHTLAVKGKQFKAS